VNFELALLHFFAAAADLTAPRLCLIVRDVLDCAASFHLQRGERLPRLDHKST
jgi:hypothetical protein